jgi:phage gpG-like protein
MIETTIDSAAVTARLAQFGPRIQAGVERSIRRIVIEGQSEIVRDRLHGGNPLFSRSGNLARAVQQQVDSDGDAITGTIGVDKTAPYGAVHEYGGTFDVREHISTSRLGKRFLVLAHTVTFQERSFLRSWLADNEGDIYAQIESAAQQAVQQ